MSERVDLCEEAKREYDRCTKFLESWEWLHLALGAATVVLIIIGMFLISTQLSTEAVITSGLSLVTGGAALWFTRQLASYRKRQEGAWNRMVEYCAERELIELLKKRAAQARRR